MLYNVNLTFKKLTNALLVLFVNYVVSKMKSSSRYDSVKDQFILVDSSNQQFMQAVAEAATGDHNKIKVMHQKRGNLENELTALVRMMELTRDPDVTYYTEPGFEVRKKPVRNNMPLFRPVIKYLRQGTLSGSLDGEVVELPDGVTQLAIQQSIDGGIAWTNGSYSAGKRFSLEGLASRNSYLVRVCFHGSHKRMSDWSEPMALFVL